jgi:hypothetical protein
MNDMETEVREALWRRSRHVPPQLEVPPSLRARVRRRIAWTALGLGGTVLVALAVALVGLQAMGGPGWQADVGSRPTPSVSAAVACTAAGLDATGSVEGAAGSREGRIDLTNHSGSPCTLEGSPTIRLLDPDLGTITAGVAFEPAAPGWESAGSPAPEGWPVVTIGPNDAASIRFRWSNWCPDGRPAPSWEVELPDGGVIRVEGMEAALPPPCNGVDLPSTIEIGPFEPSLGA